MNRLFLPLVPLSLLVTTSCEKPVVTASATESQEQIVPAARVVRSDISTSSVLTGEFEPFQEIEVMAKVAGYVQSISVDIGDRVTAGQLLAVLEVPEMKDDIARATAAIEQSSAEIEAAKDELARSESAYQIAHLSYTRVQEVAQREKGLIPLQEVDESHSRDLIAQAQLNAAKSKLRVAEERVQVAKAEEARARTMGNYVSITAPFAGVISRRYAHPGALVQAGTSSQSQAMPVVRLSQIHVLRLSLPVPESVVASVKVGQPVEVRVSALNQTFAGHVTRFTNKVDQSTRTMTTQVDVPNPDGNILPGMYAEATLGLDHHRDVLTVPLEALDRTAAGVRVYAVRGGTIEIVPVELAIEDDQKAEVKSGLNEGDVVVTARRASLKQGQRVTAEVTAQGQ